MDQKNTIGFVLIMIGAFFVIPYCLTDRFRKSKISKFIPAILSLIAILILFVKSIFFREGYSNIADIVFMILFAIIFAIFF